MHAARDFCHLLLNTQLYYQQVYHSVQTGVKISCKTTPNGRIGSFRYNQESRCIIRLLLEWELKLYGCIKKTIWKSPYELSHGAWFLAKNTGDEQIGSILNQQRLLRVRLYTSLSFICHIVANRSLWAYLQDLLLY